MHLIVVGLNHRTAPIELRERLTFTEGRLPEALQSLRSHPEFHETAILSTCNRMELYAVVPHPGHERALLQFLSEYHGVPESEYASHLYIHHDMETVRHMFRVASGLDSLVLGEAQILRQVRDAFSSATETGSVGSRLNGLFRAAIAMGRRARTETDIGRGGFSIGHAAVDLARSIFGTLKGATVLILGAGKMSELTARHLVSNGVKFVFVANRTHDRALTLAERLGGSAIHYDKFPEAMTTADIVISSTASPHPIVPRDLVQSVMRKRRGKPLFLIDIAVPRDISSDVGTLNNVFLYDVDDLEEVVADMVRDRKGEVEQVEKLIDEETAKFAGWWKSLEAVPIVTQLRAKQEAIRQSELERLRHQLPDLSDRAWQCIEAATRSLLTRVSRDPINNLKEAATQEQSIAYPDLLEAARTLFSLEEERCPKHGEETVAPPFIEEEELRGKEGPR